MPGKKLRRDLGARPRSGPGRSHRARRGRTHGRDRGLDLSSVLVAETGEHPSLTLIRRRNAAIFFFGWGCVGAGPLGERGRRRGEALPVGRAVRRGRRAALADRRGRYGSRCSRGSGDGRGRTAHRRRRSSARCRCRRGRRPGRPAREGSRSGISASDPGRTRCPVGVELERSEPRPERPAFGSLSLG